MELGFTDIREMVVYIIEWLQEFFKAAEAMLAGLTPKFPGYKPVYGVYGEEE